MKKAITLTVLLSLCLSGCCGGGGANDREPEPVVSTVSAQDCFLCGTGAGDPSYWGQNNVGIVDLSTFELLPVTVNRYDENGELIEERTGCLTCHFLSGEESGLRAHVFEDVDRGYAFGSITFNAGAALRAERMAAFLCQACLDAALESIFEDGLGAGIINFSTRELRPLEASSTDFGLGDYYIDLDPKKPEKAGAPRTVDLFLCYCPLRFSQERPEV